MNWLFAPVKTPREILKETTQAQQKARQLVRTRNLVRRSDNMLGRMRDIGAQLSQMSVYSASTRSTR